MSLRVLFCFLVGLFVSQQVRAVDYYQRHYIILVDQTTKSMSEDPDGLKQLGKMISNIFLGNDIYLGVDDSKINKSETHTKNLVFNTATDEVSVFKFGMTSNNADVDNQEHGLGRVRNSVRNGVEELSALTNELITPVASFQNSGKDIALFIKEDLDPLFQGYGDGVINMSSKVYPCVLKRVKTIPAATEYYIITVSNFKVNGQQSNDDDTGIVNSVMIQDNNHISNFYTQWKQLDNPFYTSEIMKLQSLRDRSDLTTSMTHIKAVKAVCQQLGIKSLQGVSTYITSNLRLVETGIGSTSYRLEDVDISFNKDKSLDVDSLVMKVTLSNDELMKSELLFSKNILEKSVYDESGTKSYKIPAMDIELGRVFDVGDKLNFQYLFFASTKDENGKEILPIVFTTDRDYDVTQDTLRTTEEEFHKRIKQAVIAFVALCLLIGFAIYAWKKRGAKRLVGVDFTIWSPTHDHYSEMRDKKELSYDCWYWRDGDRNINIPISGVLRKEKKFFAKDYAYKVEAQIQDVDDNMDFSFRLDRSTLASTGSTQEWNEIPMGSNGEFRFNANAYLQDQVRKPNFERDNILKVLVTIRCVMQCKNVDKVVASKSLYYTFIVRPEIDNHSIWVAFDPGTTGACVAYGVSASPLDKDDIYMAENGFELLQNGAGKSHIFPSMIRFDNKSTRLFANNTIDATALEEGEGRDFLFGNQASILWDKEGVNCFQSIKKMLGYTDPYTIVSRDGVEKEISGQDIAHLLVKGLYNHVETYITTDASVPQGMRDQFVKNGLFKPQRAIVAVPNNYTMQKKQEMWDTVYRTNKFKEVHCIYEAEAVMMMYFRENWSKLPDLKDKTFIVYDMGGATINATAFRIEVIQSEKNGNRNIRRIKVETISKIGYGVGGDDIDFALIQILYNIPSVKANVKDVKAHQRKHKAVLIELVRGLKLELIDKANGVNSISHIENEETLYGHVKEAFKRTDIDIPADPTAADRNYIGKIINVASLVNNEYLNGYVYNNIKDAVKNLLSSKVEVGAAGVELIMSGRSVLFPRVKNIVEDTIKTELQCKCNRWTGFDDENGHFNAEKVKVAVATGACWYAMYSNYVELINNKVTSSFGYIDMINNEQKYISVIGRNEQFNDAGVIEKTVPTQSRLNDVKFVQMLGAENEYDSVFKNRVMHKYNFLDEVRPSELRTTAEKITIIVDNKGNFDYKIKTEGRNELFGVKDNPFSRLSHNEVKTEIVNENSDSYIFSTLNIESTDRDAIERFKERVSGVKSGTKSETKTGAGRNRF